MTDTSTSISALGGLSGYWALANIGLILIDSSNIQDEIETVYREGGKWGKIGMEQAYEYPVAVSKNFHFQKSARRMNITDIAILSP